ncbi:MAG: glycoside hydrolase family 57 protein [Verrucomicrobiota bacterium]|nr:glycoside hydrolase family 57 protein [Verrucomicrobiota bacterium]
MLNVVFLWHMHQPYYVDTLTKTATMPWVRLHGVKGYLDMICLVEEYPEIRMNFNLTPVLVKQIVELTDGSIKDLWMEWSRTPAADLDREVKILILENFFKINWDNLIKPSARFWELLTRRGYSMTREQGARVIDHFSEQDFRDLQTWYNLGWCGYMAERQFPELKELKEKDSHFTEAEKNRVLDIHLEILKLVLKKYGDRERAGQVELTTTPFYHPILPLVYDTNFAHRCMPGREVPEKFSHPEDVEAQLRLAMEYHEKIFGQKPKGLWPSEGSVAPELIPLMKKVGLQYFCTDEANLFRSLENDPARRGTLVDHLELFQGWSAEYKGERINAVFRERPLSDFIGFVASRNTPEKACEYLVHHLENIDSVTSTKNKMVALILDGENAWEHFPDGGEAFLRCVYERLSKHASIKTCKISDYFDAHQETATTTTLNTGSWINSDFDIWIGDEEENRGWNLLGQARDFLEETCKKQNVPPEKRQAALQEIYAAEGSDWFWWYGPDFANDSDMLFDHLFRTHLQNVYRILDVEPPQKLSIPICLPALRHIIEAPHHLIHPVIDGVRSSFYEWYGAGLFESGKEQSSMFRSERVLASIHFGFDLENLYFRVDFAQKADAVLRFEFLKPASVRITTSLKDFIDGKQCVTVSQSEDGVDFREVGVVATVALKDILEMSIPLKVLPFKESEITGFFVQVLLNNVEMERYPEQGTIDFQNPGPDFELQNWSV